jgi:hypothetical protein
VHDPVHAPSSRGIAAGPRGCLETLPRGESTGCPLVVLLLASGLPGGKLPGPAGRSLDVLPSARVGRDDEFLDADVASGAASSERAELRSRDALRGGAGARVTLMHHLLWPKKFEQQSTINIYMVYSL